MYSRKNKILTFADNNLFASYSRVLILDTEGWIKIGYPVSGVVFKPLLEPIIPSYAAGILFSATFSIKNGVSDWAKFPNSVYPKSRLYCTLF
jgi:hypothetical protein